MLPKINGDRNKLPTLSSIMNMHEQEVRTKSDVKCALAREEK